MIRVAGLWVVLFGMLLNTGCVSSVTSPFTRPVNTVSMEVFMGPALISGQRTKLVIIPFSSPPYAPHAGRVITVAFYQELMKSGLFSQVAISEQVTDPNREWPISFEMKQFDLASSLVFQGRQYFQELDRLWAQVL